MPISRSDIQPLESPIRGEPFSAEHLWDHAAQLARQQTVARKVPGERPLVDRFESNSRYIGTTYQTIIKSLRDGEPIAPDAEWLVDNFYVVEEQLREIREDLPRSFYRELPKLATGEWTGFPRVYEIAHELVVHTDSSLDEELISTFVTAYQKVTPLTSGEIWAVPIMLRLVLVENLRRLCSHMLVTRDCRDRATRILTTWHDRGASEVTKLDVHSATTLITELIEALREATAGDTAPSIHDLIAQLGHPQETLDDCVRQEQQRLAANQVSIGNVITSMRLLTALDWSIFFERVSLVEHALRQDPAGVYAAMDFTTRDHYRHEVEHLAKRSGIAETHVAAAVLEKANRANEGEDADPRHRHVGYYLIDDGRIALERDLSYPVSLGERFTRAIRRHAQVLYLGGIGLITTLLVAVFASLLNIYGVSPGLNALVTLLAILPTSELAVAAVNFAVTALLRPRQLPKLEFMERIPPACQTLVVMPTMLTSEAAVGRLLERLEIHYLANPEPGINFALLTDLDDAPQEIMPGDDLLVTVANAGINALNARYAEYTQPRFYLLHRRRRWNDNEKTWMGWERKRGKLLELNRLLRGATDTSYILEDHTRENLTRTRFVITLDSDTRLPHAAGKKLIGSLAHPLNRPHFDPDKRLVTRGYGVLQPRVSVSLASANRSLFAKIFANSGGLDPYCTAVSDVYQDLFGEGSYTGKGIYDVDAFSAAIHGTFPENHILSHDLIEGCHARVGLVTDIEVFDEYPARLEADAKRQHRWVRGDWQLLPWLWRRVPAADGNRRNPLTAISRWKISDNLRRSLVAPALIALLLVGWFLLPLVAGAITCAAVLVLLLPLITSLASAILHWPTGENWRQHAREAVINLGRVALQCALALVFLPLKARNMADAVVRTLYRLFLSRRKLLEWETADAAERRLRQTPWAPLIDMGWIPLTCVLLSIVLPVAARWAAIPVLVIWIWSPAVVYWLNRPTASRQKPLSAKDRKALRRIARRTWSFFEAFVGPDDNWLPPDNFQEFPKPKIAHRTSPTNQGVFVVSAIAAHDFGYLSKTDLVDLLEKNLETCERLTRYRGHFLNWYDTTTLAPLPPRYVSTADSGNLAACLLTAQEGFEDILAAPILGQSLVDGLLDSIATVEEALSRLQPRGARFVSNELDAFEKAVAGVRALGTASPRDLLGWWQFVDRLRTASRQLPNLLHSFETTLGLKASELSTKLKLFCEHIEGFAYDVESMMPWLTTLVPATSNNKPPSIADLPTPVPGDAGREPWQAIVAELTKPLAIQQLVSLPDRIAPHLAALRDILRTSDMPVADADRGRKIFDSLFAGVRDGAHQAAECRDRYRRIGQRYEDFTMEMDFTLLYNAQRRLFAVGYNLEDGRLDRAHYDLLASEARIASLVAIAKGDADHRHWFQLGRSLTETSFGVKGLLSWGGTMFEYLMPTLFARDITGSLLEQSCRASVERQIAYGRERHVPWGISESAYSAQATNSDYHYQSFGVPGLGLKRGLGKDLVVSPYSTALATVVDAAAATDNLRALAAEGAEGPWGLYDALDYTPERVPAGERRVVVFCYMSHHQGMALAALANCLLDNCVQRRFQRQPLARSIELLLQERIPLAVLQFQPQDDSAIALPPLPTTFSGPVSRRISTPATDVPRAHLLSNGRYNVMVTNAGGGYSRCRDIALTRWRSDATRDDWGQFVYLRNTATGKVWSAAHQPTRVPADTYVVTYFVDKAEYRRQDGDVETQLEVTLSPENNAEARQITVFNHGKRPVTIEVTSYGEIVLSTTGADVAHPAFNKMFVETEYLADRHALLARRRPRDVRAEPAWAVHVLAASPTITETLEFDTDRARFLGRGRIPASPAALDPGAKLSGTTGCVLDPVFSLRCTLQIPPDESASVAFITAFAESRDEALQLADQYRDPRVVQRTFEMAWAHSQVEMRHLHESPAEMQLYQRLASAVLFPDAALRAPLSVLKANRLGQRALWRYGISGDDPIVLLRISQPGNRSVLRELLLAHEFWSLHGLKVDLVVVNEQPAGYFDEFQQQLLELMQTTGRLPMGKSGGVYLLRSAQLAPEDSVLLQAIATISLDAAAGPLARQVETAMSSRRTTPPAFKPVAIARDRAPLPAPLPLESGALDFAGSHGGFNDAGDYTILLRPGEQTPLPWSNVVANPQFGFLVTESGGGYTWAGNSRENKLTSWSNDPVTDPPSEILYLRDEETGDVWTAAPLASTDSDYLIHHGRGASRFTHRANGIHSDLLLSIAPDACVKLICLKLRNETDRPRAMSATQYVEWVLGVHRQMTQMHVYTSRDEATGAVLAENSYHEDFPDQIAFLHVLGKADSITGDRTEFIGRNGTESSPAALRRMFLSGTTGAGLDPCGAVQRKITLSPGAEAELIFLVGWTDGKHSVAETIAPFDSPQKVQAAIDATVDFWHRTSSTIEIKTPNRAMDLLVNQWLLYQTLSCRVWGRSAFYQSGGAYGFRDQLQDVMAVVYSQPAEARRVILQAASRQFEQGDVQHWWHPPTGRGVRTRFSDDYLWLPFVTCHYITTTGDAEILKEQLPYLRSQLLDPHEDERYELPEQSPLVEDLFGHCLRSIDHGFRFGAHGLPLMGTGDWNDGMNKVGAGGKGESVWLAWFLRLVLERFAPLVEARGDHERATAYRDQSKRLLAAIESQAWDGEWYRRAFFDDGTPLGSKQNDECRIDSLAQSWSVIAGTNLDRSTTAMQSLEQNLIRPQDRLVLLLAPPFDHTALDPGYIKGYPPGIRENGGQYTHAAMWVIQALAMQGRGTRATEVFDLLNPILAATSPAGEATYRGEPYVVAADVYSQPPHVGRAGWTWYTGSAAWMYRAAVESILGIAWHASELTISPCIPANWPEFHATLRRGSTTWRIEVRNPQHVESGVANASIDGRNTVGAISLVDDGGEHLIEVTLGIVNRLAAPNGMPATNMDDRHPAQLAPAVQKDTAE